MERASAGFGPGTFDELVAAWLYTHRSANTQAAYGRDLRAFAAWCHGDDRPPLAASGDDLTAFQTACLEGGSSPATVQRRMSAVASFFAWTYETGSLPANPMLGVARHAVDRGGDGAPAGLSPDEVLDLLAATAATEPKSAVLVALLLRDGLGLHEVLALDVPDIVHRPSSPRPLQPEAGHGPRRPSASRDETAAPLVARVTRRGRDELLDLDVRTGADVRRYLGDRSSGPLLLGDSPTGGGRRLTRYGADYLLKRVGRAAGLREPLTARTLRVTYAAMARAAGAHVDAIRHQVGHRDGRSTRRLLDRSDGRSDDRPSPQPATRRVGSAAGPDKEV